MAAVELYTTPLYADSRLIAYYRMSNSALTTDSKGSYTLTNNNTVSNGTGKFDGGADGGTTNTNKSLSISSALGLSGGNAAKSISCWFKMNTELSGADSFGTLVSIANADTDTLYRIGYWRTSNTNKVIVNRGKNSVGTTELSSAQTLGTTNFNHLVLTWDGTTLTGYFNGTSFGSSTPSGNGTNGLSDRLTILSDFGGNYQSAIIDEVAIFNAALTADDVANLYNGYFNAQRRITRNTLTVYATDTNATTFSTLSISPNINVGDLVGVQSTIAAGTGPNEPTLSGNGLTWARVDGIQETNANVSRLTVFRAIGASPSAGALTADFGGESQTTCAMVVVEFRNTLLSGTNWADAIVQSKTGQVSGTNTGITVTFDNPFSSPFNATVAFWAIDRGIAMTPGSGFADAGNTGGGASSLQCEFRNDNSATASASWASGTTRGMMVAMEMACFAPRLRGVLGVG